MLFLRLPCSNMVYKIGSVPMYSVTFPNQMKNEILLNILIQFSEISLINLKKKDMVLPFNSCVLNFKEFQKITLIDKILTNLLNINTN